MNKENIFKSKRDKAKTENNRQWATLINKIVQGEVVPVIGPEFMASYEKEDSEDNGNDDKNTEEWVNPHLELINQLAESMDIEPGQHQSFSELLYDDAFPASERMEIYDMLGEVFEQEIAALNRGELPRKRIFAPSSLLIKLLKTCRFRFVITTSFTPVVEYAMKEIYGTENVRVLNFSNNPSGNDDIEDVDDIQKPTVYYMFGRVCRQEKRYVVNDSDMLSFCRSWLSNAPKTLVSVLKDKYLLLLGNSYSDWLCRFVWYSMKTKLETELKGMVVNPAASESLLQFMKRIDAFTQQDPKAVIERIDTLIEAERASQEENKFKKPEINTDVFISYSRRDGDVVKTLYDQLREKGLRVWYDKEKLDTGAKFMDDIKLAIRKTRIFIPVLSHHIEDEKNESHPYRTEWDTALEVDSTYGRNFIMPVCEKGFDFYNGCIPEKLQRHNAKVYDKEKPDFSEFVNEVYNYLMSI
jgi:hypothetical protein